MIARAVIGALRFRASQHVISLIAGLDLESLRPLISPATHCVRAIPVPSVALRRGPVAIFPMDATAASLFRRIGDR